MQRGKSPHSLSTWLYAGVESIRSSLWFVPLGLTLFGIALARVLVVVDNHLDVGKLPLEAWLYSGVPDNAKSVLSALAASLITVAGTAFSITIVVLSFASKQLGPRLLRNFMRDRATQCVLGGFMASFCFQMVVLTSIRTSGDSDFVPRVAISVALLLAATSFGSLIFFIHHVANSISVDVVVGEVHAEFLDGVERMFERCSLSDQLDPEVREFPEPFEHELRARDSGYLQLVDFESMAKLAAKQNARIRLQVRPGQFVPEGSLLFRSTRKLEGNAERFHECVVLGSRRTETQDIEHAIRQLVEIALRALSPGINDPFTAISCVDHLGDALGRLSQCRMPVWQRTRLDGVDRVESPGTTFRSAMDMAWNQIRQESRNHPAIQLRVLEALTHLADRLQGVPAALRHDRAESVRVHAELILATSKLEAGLASDEHDLQTRWLALLERLGTLASAPA